MQIINFKCLVILFFLTLTATGTAFAEKAEEKPSEREKSLEVPSLNPIESIEMKLKDIELQIEEAKKAETQQKAEELGVTVSELAERTELLSELEGVYQRQLTALKRQGELKKQEENLKTIRLLT